MLFGLFREKLLEREQAIVRLFPTDPNTPYPSMGKLREEIIAQFSYLRQEANNLERDVLETTRSER